MASRKCHSSEEIVNTLRHLEDIHMDRNCVPAPCHGELLGLGDEVPSLELANAHRSYAVCLDANGNGDAATKHWLTRYQWRRHRQYG